MNSVPPLPPEVLAWRRQAGVDELDEMWDGILHVPPSPTRYHQDFVGELEAWLRRHWVPLSGGRVYHDVNVSPGDESPGDQSSGAGSDWRRNYRIPDLVLLGPDRLAIDRNTYFHGGPTVCVELRSPGDEAWEKLGFYAALDVREVWIIDRPARRLDLLVLGAESGGYAATSPAAPLAAPGTGDDANWVRSPATNVEFLSAPDGTLDVRLSGDDATRLRLP